MSICIYFDYANFLIGETLSEKNIKSVSAKAVVTGDVKSVSAKIEKVVEERVR